MPEVPVRSALPTTRESVESFNDAKEHARASYESAKDKLTLILRERHKNRQYGPPDDILLRAKDLEELSFQVYRIAVFNFNRYMKDCQRPEA